MKFILLFIITICLLIGCNGLIKSDKVKEFMPGTYISSWKTEFSESVDTLLIEHLMKQGSETFAVTRRTYTSFYKNGRSKVPEYKIKKSAASYDANNKTLFIENDGSILSFDPLNKEMKRGNTSYRKL